MKVFKPHVGGKVWATSEHPSFPEGYFVGHVIKVEDNIAIFQSNGDTDRIIWQFTKGDLNRFHSFSV